MRSVVKEALVRVGWMQKPGAYVLIDGAYGSCGKGAVAALMGELFGDQIDWATTNAGCNSGHIGYMPESYGSVAERFIKTQQAPVASIVAARLYGRGRAVPYLNSGAIIDPIILREEVLQYGIQDLVVHPNAAIIDYDRRNDDVESTNKIASTSKGVGTALARKVMREESVAKFRLQDFGGIAKVQALNIDYDQRVVWVESAQGYSLGIDQQFYPYCTSRICSVGQALADAAIPHNKVRKVVMVCRSYPIRVGSTDKGSSGDCYPDQIETSWEALGLAPELTTVTKRVRRVFTWSRTQFKDAVRTNQPNVIVLSFMDYIQQSDWAAFIHQVRDDYRMVMGDMPDAVLLGCGPYTTDMKLWEE